MSKKMNQQFACSSMMLPEHRGRLNRERKETRWQEEHRRALLDEQEQERFQRALEQSLQQGIPLKLTVLNNSGYHHLWGRVVKLEPWAGRIRLLTSDLIETVLIDDIVGVTPANPELEDI